MGSGSAAFFLLALTGYLFSVNWQAIHANPPKTALQSDSYHFSPPRTQIIAHKRRHRSPKSHTPSVRQDRSSRFSTQLFHALQDSLGISVNNSASRRGPPAEKVISQRSPRRRTTESPPNNEVLAAGYPWSSPPHGPYRYRYKYSSFYYPPRGSLPEDPSVAAGVTIDPCILARWNYEVNPDMFAFMWELLHLSLESYLHLDSSGDVFEIPPGFDLKKCNFKKSEDPLLKSVNHLLNLYSSKSTTTELLFGLVKAAKACFGKEDQAFPMELLPCLDFSFGSEQVLNLKPYRSIFGNPELCRRYLEQDSKNCTPSDHLHPCNAFNIQVLNDFARYFYQCPKHEESAQSESLPWNQSEGNDTASFDDDQDEDLAHLWNETSSADRLRHGFRCIMTKVLPAFLLVVGLTF